MIDWTELADRDMAVPADLDAAVPALLTMLASADPVQRDDLAYSFLAVWTDRGVLDGRLAAIGDALLPRFGHPETQARTFVPLVLAAAVRRDSAAGVLDAVTVRRWLDAFAAWWPAETDTRGFDERLGWLHAVAHGADLAGAFAASARLTGDEAAGLLTLVATRATAETTERYAQQEEDRLASAVVDALRRPDLTEAGAVGWLAVVDRLFATGEPGPVPVPVANTLAVLRAVYVMADRHAVPHRRAVTDAVAARLHEAFGDYPLSRSEPPGRP
jgi:hypothetical protein